MNNWIDDKIKRNNQISESLIPELRSLKAKYPDESEALNELIFQLEKGLYDDNFLLEIRNKLRRIITRNERNLIQKKDDIWNLNYKIRQFESSSPDTSDSLIDEYFFGEFNFKTDPRYYYLRLPKLHVYTDKNEKSEFMIDRYIRDFLSDAIPKYQNSNDINIEKFKTFSLIFLHHITPENAKKYDTDNIEIKKPIDGINGRLIENDTAERSDIYQIIVPDEVEYTELFVLKGQGLGESIINLLNELKG